MKKDSEPPDLLAILTEIGKALTSTLDLEQVLKMIMKIITEHLEPRDWSLLMVDEESDELYFVVAVGKVGDTIKNLRLKMGEGIAGWVALHGQPLITQNAYEDERFAKWVDRLTGFHTNSVICVPLISKGRSLGVIELFNLQPDKFSPSYMKVLNSLADFAAIAIENAQSVRRIKDLTIIDDVTGLYNSRHMHTLLETEISRSARDGNPFSVVFLDLDHFKNVNDNYGHLVGSRLLKEIGQLLKFNLRTIDWATRYGGDEFVLILPRTALHGSKLVAERLRRTLNDSVFFEKEKLFVRITASFGLATYPDNAKSKEDIIRLADQAMYRAKDAGRNNVIHVQDDKGNLSLP